MSVILVVEDEPLLRLSAVDMFQDAGFDVVWAANSSEAIAILEARPDIHILFTDVDMFPGVDGVRLAALVREPSDASTILHQRPVLIDWTDGCIAVISAGNARDLGAGAERHPYRDRRPVIKGAC